MDGYTETNALPARARLLESGLPLKCIDFCAEHLVTDMLQLSQSYSALGEEF